MSENPLDRYLSERIRTQIEEAYYARVNAQGQLERLVQDPDFWENPDEHPALFSDHGIVHVRDVAGQILQVLKTINGVLIPNRGPDRMEFMYAYGVMVAYLHDIGMADLSAFGRAMHPEFAAQAVFTEELAEIVEAMWAEDGGEVTGRLNHLFKGGVLKREPQIIFRELLSLSFCHSKSKMPIQVLDDPAALRSQMHFILSHNLWDLYQQQFAAKFRPTETDLQADLPARILISQPPDLESQAFDWLTCNSTIACDFVRDVIDTLRALRCADALRQRGTVQKTSGGYEVFVSQKSGNAVFALRLGDDRLYLLELPDAISAGEANIASSEVDKEGDLRISFHRGAYVDEDVLYRSADSTAMVIHDILGDILDNFWRREKVENVRKASGKIQILLESTDDNPRFVEIVQEKLRRLTPAYAEQIHIVPSLQNVSALERNRYLAAPGLDWNLDQRRKILTHMAQSGQKGAGIDLVEAFRQVKMIELAAGETLIEAGAPPAFVYIPLGEGLKIIPLGGYRSFSVAAWMPVGNTSAIRGATRNADVVAEGALSLLAIPKEVYLQHWYRPYTQEEFRSLLGK